MTEIHTAMENVRWHTSMYLLWSTQNKALKMKLSQRIEDTFWYIFRSAQL